MSEKLVVKPANLTSVRAFGFGACYSGVVMEEAFVESGVACLGYDYREAPELYNIMSQIQPGDMVFLKRYGPSSTVMTVLAVGVCTDATIEVRKTGSGRLLGLGIKVQWVRTAPFKIKTELVKDKLHHHRLGSIYMEMNPRILVRIASKYNEALLNLSNERVVTPVPTTQPNHHQKEEPEQKELWPVVAD